MGELILFGLDDGARIEFEALVRLTFAPKELPPETPLGIVADWVEEFSDEPHRDNIVAMLRSLGLKFQRR